jgi:hypothetical protein
MSTAEKEPAFNPNEALADARQALDELRILQEEEADDTDGELTEEEAAVDEIADAFEDLDKWISGGGALPDAWKRPVSS